MLSASGDIWWEMFTFPSVFFLRNVFVSLLFNLRGCHSVFWLLVGGQPRVPTFLRFAVTVTDIGLPVYRSDMSQCRNNQKQIILGRLAAPIRSRNPAFWKHSVSIVRKLYHFNRLESLKAALALSVAFCPFFTMPQAQHDACSGAPTSSYLLKLAVALHSLWTATLRTRHQTTVTESRSQLLPFLLEVLSLNAAWMQSVVAAFVVRGLFT